MEGDEGARRARDGDRPDDTPLAAAPRRAEREEKIKDLLRQGEELFRAGRYQQAVQIWTRILFLDRGNRAAREAIEQGKRAIAEQERQLDALVSEAASRFEAGHRREARRLLAQLLARDPRHREARSLWEKLEALERRGPGSVSIAGRPLEEERPRRARRRPVSRGAGGPAPASPLKMAAFLFCALCLFGAGALYLHLNWDFLVSEGPLASSRNARSAASVALDIPALPSPSELHYYNGARLYAKGWYRAALSELARVERRSPSFAAARGLILRIEERLLRVASGEGASPRAPALDRREGSAATPSREEGRAAPGLPPR